MTTVATSVGSGRSTYRSIIPPDILPIIKPAIDKNNTWCLYLLECKGGSYYAGITNDLEARFAAHQSGQGARYTRANPPVRIIASKPYPDRSAASIAEARLKRIPRHAKVDFFLHENPS